jgi:hypothetical protein
MFYGAFLLVLIKDVLTTLSSFFFDKVKYYLFETATAILESAVP